MVCTCIARYGDAGNEQEELTYTRKVGKLLVDTLSNDWTGPGHSEEQQERCLKCCENQEDQDSECSQWPAWPMQKISLPWWFVHESAAVANQTAVVAERSKTSISCNRTYHCHLGCLRDLVRL